MGEKVELDWDIPQYDPSRYQLQGFEVYRLVYDGSGTAPRTVLVNRLPEGVRGWEEAYRQSHRWNTGGDIRGYRVDAVMRDIGDPGMQRVVRVGSDAFAPV